MFVGCTKNQRAKQFGGTMEIEIPTNKKFVNATWKDDDLWYLTRDRKPGEEPETWTFEEDSSFGVLEGKVIFIEK